MSTDDKKIKELFTAYDPKLSSDADFMENLARRMKTVELLKEKTAEMRRQNHLAVTIATITGFMAGIVFTLCFPYLSGMVEALARLAGETGVNFAMQFGDLSAWVIIAMLTGTLSYTAYDITLLAAPHFTRKA